MADLPTLEAAMKLADQDSPLPSLAGPALKRLRNAVNGLSIYEESMQDAMVRIMRAVGIVGGKPAEVAAEVEKRLAERVDTQADKGDSATLTALIAELRGREARGRGTYGTDVDRTDLNNAQWRQHLREELMDALLYSLAEERTRPMEVVECGGCAPPVAASPGRPVEDMQWPFQGRVAIWMEKCFGEEIAADGVERNHRFLEEAIELVQACGCTASEAHQLVDYVFGRLIGEKAQEVGGVMVTLAALCQAQVLDMKAAGETELARVWTKIEQIRAKQAAKPKHSPLPGSMPAYGIDQGSGDKTVEAFGHMNAGGRMHFAQFVESEPNGQNSGHGHVRPRPDGVKARCGGPRMCRVCWNEERNIETTRMVAAVAKMPPVKIGDWVKVACDEAGDPSVTVIPEAQLYTCAWCETCRPITVDDMRMVLCPTCGNKHCPHAHDHRNACTHSNAVGQPGSSWEHVKPPAPPAPEDC